MRIVRGDASDRATTQACFEAVRAAGEADDPFGPPWSLGRMRSWAKYPAEPAETWLSEDEADGTVHGWYFLTLPDRENRDRAYVYLTVRPASRRQGIGTALLRHAAGRAANAAPAEPWNAPLPSTDRPASADRSAACRSSAVPIPRRRDDGRTVR